MSDRYIETLEELIALLENRSSFMDGNGGKGGASPQEYDSSIYKFLSEIIEGKNRTQLLSGQDNSILSPKESQSLFASSLKVKESINNVISISSNKWRWNIATGHVEFSPSWCNSLGYEVSEIIPHVDSWKDILHPDDFNETFDKLKPHLEGFTPVYLCRNRLRMKNGSWRKNLDVGRVIERDLQKQPLMMEGVDIAFNDL
jgi:PAS domain-containing protein